MKERKRMSQATQIRIMIVEDHFVVCEGLKVIINSQQDMVTVAEAGNGRHAVEAFEQHQPDVTLMNLRIPGLNGVDAISNIVGKFPRTDYCVVHVRRRREYLPCLPGWRPRLFSQGY